MGLFSRLVGRKPQGNQETATRENNADRQSTQSIDARTAASEAARTKMVGLRLTEEMNVKSGRKDVAEAPEATQREPAKPAVNIWDVDAGPASPPAATQRSTAPVPLEPRQDINSIDRNGSNAARKRRTKTRLLGFDTSDDRVVDIFNNPVVKTSARGARFPIGWVVVIKGPGRGESFTLLSGMSSIGRGEDQTIQLDFGDDSISRSNHAAIVYDPETFQVFLGHGGKSNIVRLNGKPVISNEQLKDGDTIRMGETTLRFVGF
ncbi:MAG: FHA domain-containing protein, partial [Paracoccaceae bacterium]